MHYVYFRGEPLKKKKKLDPVIIRGREERKKKKLQKRLRQLEKHANHMKPVFEIDTLPELLQNEYVLHNDLLRMSYIQKINFYLLYIYT